MAAVCISGGNSRHPEIVISSPSIEISTLLGFTPGSATSMRTARSVSRTSIGGSQAGRGKTEPVGRKISRCNCSARASISNASDHIHLRGKFESMIAPAILEKRRLPPRHRYRVFTASSIAIAVSSCTSSTAPLGTLGKSTNEGNSLQLAIGETHCLFQFCIERFQSIRRLFLQHCSSRTGGARRIVEAPRWRSAYVATRQPKWRTVGRAAAYHILWVRGYRDHTISRRGFNLFKPLRRHFQATPFLLSRPLASRSRQPKRLGSKDRRSARPSPQRGRTGRPRVPQFRGGRACRGWGLP